MRKIVWGMAAMALIAWPSLAVAQNVNVSATVPDAHTFSGDINLTLDLATQTESLPGEVLLDYNYDVQVTIPMLPALVHDTEPTATLPVTLACSWAATANPNVELGTCQEGVDTVQDFLVTDAATSTTFSFTARFTGDAGTYLAGTYTGSIEIQVAKASV